MNSKSNVCISREEGAASQGHEFPACDISYAELTIWRELQQQYRFWCVVSYVDGTFSLNYNLIIL